MITVCSVLVAAFAAGGRCAVHRYKSGRFLETTDDAYAKAGSVKVRPQVHGHITAVLVADRQGHSSRTAAGHDRWRSLPLAAH